MKDVPWAICRFWNIFLFKAARPVGLIVFSQIEMREIAQIIRFKTDRSFKKTFFSMFAPFLHPQTDLLNCSYGYSCCQT